MEKVMLGIVLVLAIILSFLIDRTAELSAATKSWPTRAELPRHRDAWLHDCQVICVR